MADNDPPTIGETLEQILDRVIFEDPATHRLRDEWEQTKRTEQEVFDRVCQEEYKRRVEYHQICQTPDPEEVAREEVRLLTPLLREELDERLMILWQDTLRRVRTVLADKAAEAEETPDTDSSAHAGGSPRT